MAVSDIPEYLSLVKVAREEASFPFFWGFECEWAPEYDSWYRDYLVGEIGAQYLVYGAHWVRIDGNFHYVPEVSDPGMLGRYVDMTVKGLSSGLYSIFAHPDIFLAGYTSMTADVRAACRDIIEAAIACNVWMEVNGLGMIKDKVQTPAGLRYGYPVREFWQMAAEAGAAIMCNSDAHAPEQVLSGARLARDFSRQAGIEPSLPLSVERPSRNPR